MKKPSASFIIAILVLVVFVIWLGVRFLPSWKATAPAVAPAPAVSSSTSSGSGIVFHTIKLPILTLKSDQAKAKASGASCYDITYQDRAIAPTDQPVLPALQELFKDDTGNPGSINGVSLGRIEIFGSVVVIYLKGSVIQNDHCGVDLIRQKINKTAFQFYAINVTKVLLNGKSFKSVD